MIPSDSFLLDRMVKAVENVRQRLAKTSLKGEFVVLIAPTDFVL